MQYTFGKGRAVWFVTQNKPQRVKRVNEATQTLAASLKIKISVFFAVAQSHSAHPLSHYLISECDGVMFSGF